MTMRQIGSEVAKECPQKLEEARKNSPLEPLGGGAQSPCRHLDSRLLTSRIVRQYSSTVLSHPVCENFLQQPQETNIDTKTSGEGMMLHDFKV